MRPTVMILLACFVAAPVFAADDTGKRTYPADDRPACMDRSMDSARGGCVTREDGSPRAAAPLPLPPEPDTTRQSPPESAAKQAGELPTTSSTER